MLRSVWPSVPRPPLPPPTSDPAMTLFKKTEHLASGVFRGGLERDPSFSSPWSLWKPEVSTRMVMATNRQRFKVTFSHGFSIWLRFWMDKALCKEAAATSETSTTTAGGWGAAWWTHWFWKSSAPWLKSWPLLWDAAERHPAREQFTGSDMRRFSWKIPSFWTDLGGFSFSVHLWKKQAAVRRFDPWQKHLRLKYSGADGLFIFHKLFIF